MTNAVSLSRAAVAVLVSFALAGCKVKDPLYCDESTPCTDPALPYCDLQGDYPASDGIKRTCIAYPWDAGAPDASPPPCTSGEWVLDTIDNGNVGGSTGPPGLAVDSSGVVHVAYPAGNPAELRYAFGRPGSWNVVETQEAGGYYPQLIIDSSDVVHVVHSGVPGGLGYLRKSVADEDFDYELATTGGAYDLGFDLDATGQPVACYFNAEEGGPPGCLRRSADGWDPIESPETVAGLGNSIAIDSSDRLHLTVDGLDYLSKGAGAWGGVERIENADPYATVVVDSDGTPHVAYTSGGKIRYGHRVGPDAWNRGDVEATVASHSPSIAVDADDVVHIAYVDMTNSNLKYALRDGDAWSPMTVDSSITIPAGPRVFSDSNRAVHIVYYDQNDNDLRYAHLCP